MILIEVNDAAITLFADGEARVASPGYITIERREAIIGEDSKRRAKVDPTLTENGFWQALSTDELARPSRLARQQADLVYFHLEDLWRRAGAPRGDVVLAVPGDLNASQLQLLLGIAKRLAIPVRAVVDCAVAAAPGAVPGRQLWHLDLHLHRLILTELIQGSNLERGAVHTSSEVGVTRIQDAWAHRVAAIFVRDTRFDPLHEAHVEQSLYDQLEAWSAALDTESRVAVSLEHGGSQFAATLDRSELIAAAEPLLTVVTGFIERRIAADRPVRLLTTPRAAAVCGLVGRLAALPLIEPRVLEPAATASGARRLLMERSRGGGVPFILKRPWFSRTELERHASQAHDQGALMPTHLLVGAVARPLTDRAGVAVDPTEGLVINATGEGPVVLVRRDQRIELIAGEGAAVRINGQTPAAGQTLRAGDRLRIDDDDLEATLIRVESDGA